MQQPVLPRISRIGILVAIGVFLGLPAKAQYTKLYQFTNQTGVSQTSVKAITNGLESITSQYSVPSGWNPATLGTVLISGVYNTSIAFKGTSLVAGTGVTVGWSTADNSCRLRDLRWGSGVAIVPSQLGGVPGGGMMFYDYPAPGQLTVVITNDTDGPLNLTSVEHATSDLALDLTRISSLASRNMAELHVSAINADMAVIRAEVVYYGSTGVLPAPSVRSLTGKLDKATSLINQGLAAYLAGNLPNALYLWGQAAKYLDGFVSEVTNSSTKGNLPQYLYDRWVVDGDGEITPVPQIRDATKALPKGTSLQSLPPLPAGVLLPPGSGLDPDNCIPWPTSTLQPGQYTAFVVDDATPGGGFIMRGSVVGTDGKNYLNWIEQSVVETFTPDEETPANSSIVINGGTEFTRDTSVTIDIHGEDNIGISAYEVIDASGTVIGTVNPAANNFSTQLSGAVSTGDGVKTVTARFSDTTGNWSSECTDTIVLDQTPPTVTATATKADGTPYTAGAWTNQDVTVHFECSDDTSGVATAPEDFTVSAEGTTESVSGTAVDKAGNSTTATFGAISIDKTAPTITGSRTPEANANGWNNTDVTVSFTASDDGSCIASVTPDTLLSTEGAGQSVTGTAVGKAGNSASVTISGINIDKTPPVVTVAAPGAGTYVLNQPGVVAAWSATDALSGVAPPSNGTVPIDTGLLGNGTQVTVPAGAAVDLAGNRSQEAVLPYSVSVVYGFGGLLSPYAPPSRTFQLGNSIPLKWQYTDVSGAVVDSSAAGPSVSVTLIEAPGTPGNTDLNYDSSSRTWQFNWQTTGCTTGVYSIFIKSSQTGQIDGPFYIEIK